MTKATAEQVLRLGQLIERGEVTGEMLVDLMAGAGNATLTLIHAGVEIAATTGYETIARSPEVFKGFLDPDFERWGTDVRGIATPPAKVDVWEMDPDKCPDATFREMFESLGNPDNLVLTQGQIVDFCQRHPDLLRGDGFATLFLFRTREERFVAYVDVDGDVLLARVYRFSDGARWDAVVRHRVVVLQQCIWVT